MRYLQRIAVFSLDWTLWRYIQSETPLFIDGFKVRTTSPRLRTYLKGVTCVRCGITGSFFALEQAPKGKTRQPHLNLYASKNGVEVMMTSDHIVPKSKGGRGHLGNRQPMCISCNAAKGNADETGEDSYVAPVRIQPDFLTEESWSREHLATTACGSPITPHSPDATNFSLLGAMIKETLQPCELWNLRFEKLRSMVINILMHNHDISKLTSNSFRHMSLQELNASVEWPSMRRIVELLQSAV